MHTHTQSAGSEANGTAQSVPESAAAVIEATLGPGITAPDVARVLSVATSIAAEHLLTAEARCVCARVCACACVCVCVRVRVCACVCVL
jgi:hypothetical protein